MLLEANHKHILTYFSGLGLTRALLLKQTFFFFSPNSYPITVISLLNFPLQLPHSSETKGK